MEALFELFSNPITLFILIGVISSLFNKAKGNAQQQQRPARPARPPQDLSQPAEAEKVPQRESRREFQRESRPVQQRKMQAEAIPGTLTEIQKVYQERKEQAEKIESKQRAGDRRRMSSGDSGGRLRQEQAKKQPVLEFKPDEERLVEGIIWAEVLGNPRSKQPYRLSRRN